MNVDKSAKTMDAFYQLYSSLMRKKHHKESEIMTEDELVRRINGMSDDEELVITPVGGGQ